MDNPIVDALLADEVFRQKLARLIAETTSRLGVKPSPAPQPTQPEDDDEFFCADCGQKLQPYQTKKGNWITPDWLAVETYDQYGQVLCQKCGQARWKQKRLNFVKRIAAAQ